MDKESIKPVEILESNLLNWIEAFLFDRQSTGLSKNTIEFYRRRGSSLLLSLRQEYWRSPDLQEHIQNSEEGSQKDRSG